MSIIMANFISFYTLHVAALIILFKGLTNFPKERNNEEPRVQTYPENRNLIRILRNWGGRKRRGKYEWRYTRCMTKLILATMVATHLTDTITKLNNPDNPKHTFTRLLYSLAHDAMITNNLGNDIPIRSATMTRNRSKIRKDLKNLIKSLNSITEYGKKSLDNIVNVRNKDVRNITKMISKVWTYLLRKVWTFFQRTHTNPKKTEEHWSPKNLGNDIPIRSATMTRNRSKIRKDLKNLIKSLNSITEYGKKSLDNIVNVRNKDVRNITKMISKVWTYLLRKVWTFFQRTHTNPKKTEEHWSPKNCGECDICVQRGPQSLCPYCNAKLRGLVNYLKVNAEIIITLPSDILKSMAWTLIKYPLISTLEKVLAHLIYHETIPLTGLLIMLRTTITLLNSNTPREHRKYDKTGNSGEKETKNKGRTKQNHPTTQKA